jgi:hypothetical protein
MEQAYDMITFGSNFFEDVERLIECMYNISGHSIFHDYTLTKVKSEGLNAIPAWFHPSRSNHFSEWIL